MHGIVVGPFRPVKRPRPPFSARSMGCEPVQRAEKEVEPAEWRPCCCTRSWTTPLGASPDGVALVTDAGTQTFAELRGSRRRGRGRHRRADRARRPGGDPGREPRRVRRVLLRRPARRAPARPPQPAAPSRRMDRQPRSDRVPACSSARPSCSTGSIRDAARGAGVETIVGLDGERRLRVRGPGDGHRRCRTPHRRVTMTWRG